MRDTKIIIMLNVILKKGVFEFSEEPVCSNCEPETLDVEISVEGDCPYKNKSKLIDSARKFINGRLNTSYDAWNESGSNVGTESKDVTLLKNTEVRFFHKTHNL